MNVCSKTNRMRNLELLPGTSLARTSTVTIENVKTSPSLLSGPPLKISGAAHVVVFVTVGSRALTGDPSPRMMDVSPKSVSRTRPSPSIRMFAFEFVGIRIRL